MVSARENASDAGLRFNWPTKGRLEVSEQIKKKGQQVSLVSTIEYAHTNQEVLLNWIDAKILSMNGQPITDAETKKTLAPVEMMFRYPTFRISTNGEFLGTLQTKESVKELNRLLDQAVPDRSAESRNYYERMSESAAGRAMMDKILGQIWITWVEQWTEINLSAGEVLKQDVEIPLSSGRKIPGNVTISHLGNVPSKTNLIHLRYEEKIKADKGDDVLADIVGGMAGALGEQLKKPFPKTLEFERLVVVEIHTDAKTLQPVWAKRNVSVSTQSESEGKISAKESNEYHFRWMP